jgi:hypothetical protein
MTLVQVTSSFYVVQGLMHVIHTLLLTPRPFSAPSCTCKNGIWLFSLTPVH